MWYSENKHYKVGEGGMLVSSVSALYLLFSSSSSVSLIISSISSASSSVPFAPFCLFSLRQYKMIHKGWHVFNPSLAEHDMPCLSKHCRSRSVGFWRSQLIWICTVCHTVCEFIATIQIKHSDLLKIRSGHGILIYSAWQGLNRKFVQLQTVLPVHFQNFIKIYGPS